MGNGARIVKVIYVTDQEQRDFLVSIGDTVRAQDWAEGQYPDNPRKAEERAGLYACFLGAKRKGLPGTDGDYLEWLDQVTMPDDEAEDTEDTEEASEPEPGEGEQPPSGS